MNFYTLQNSFKNSIFNSFDEGKNARFGAQPTRLTNVPVRWVCILFSTFPQDFFLFYLLSFYGVIFIFDYRENRSVHGLLELL